MKAERSKLHERLKESGQAHVLAHWDKLTEAQREALHDQINSLDLKTIESLYLDRDKVYEVPDESRIQPAPCSRSLPPREQRRPGAKPF